MRRAAGIAAFAAVCLAAGCSGSSGHAPSTDPSRSVPSTPVSSSSSPSTPPSTPTAPTVPADVPTTGPNVNGPTERPPVEPILATEQSAAGAKAFAEFFIRTIDWGYATTSSTYMRHYFQPSCKQCVVVANLLDNARRNGDHYVGGRITIKSSHVLGFGPSPTVDLLVLVTADEVVDRNGKPKDADVAYPNLNERIFLIWAHQGWLVTDMRGSS